MATPLLDTQLDTVDLLAVISVQDSISSFWLGLFPDQINFETQEIMFDVVSDGTRELAPFVAPNVQGRMIRSQGYTTKTFKPAYVKPKHVVDPSRALARRAGEALTGSLSAQDRFDAIVANNMAVEKKQIENRWEWMAARAVIDGKVTVTGEDYPTVTVDFGRDASLTGTMLTTTRWGLLSADPLADLELYRARVQRLSGTSINKIIFGVSAWAKFAANPKVKQLLSTLYRGSGSNFNRAIAAGTPVEYRGQVSGEGGVGQLDLYTYSDFYREVDPATGVYTEIQMMDPNYVVGLGDGINGCRCFGAIMDKKAGLAALPMFPKMWDVEDPSATYTMTQSAPLMVPRQPNASFCLHIGDAAIEYPATVTL